MLEADGSDAAGEADAEPAAPAMPKLQIYNTSLACRKNLELKAALEIACNSASLWLSLTQNLQLLSPRLSRNKEVFGT